MDFLSEAKNINTLISVCVYKLHVVISVIYCFSFTKSKRKSHLIPFGMYTVRQDVHWTCTMVCLFSLWEIIPFLRKQNQNKQTSLQTKYMYKLFFCQKFWHHMYYSHHFQCVKYHTNATWQSRINPQNLILASRHFFSTMDFVLQTYMYGQNFLSRPSTCTYHPIYFTTTEMTNLSTMATSLQCQIIPPLGGRHREVLLHCEKESFFPISWCSHMNKQYIILDNDVDSTCPSWFIQYNVPCVFSLVFR